jgi:hypothetical protein
VGDARYQERLYLDLEAALRQLWERQPTLRARVPAASARRRWAMCHFMAAVHAVREGDWPRAALRFDAAARIAPAVPLFLAGWLAARPLVRRLALPLLRSVAARTFRGWS